MNIYEPIITNILEEGDIHKELEVFKEEGITIENKRFSKLEEFDLNAEEAEFEKCIFENCKITGSFEKATFHDVIFINCDLSNCLFMEGSFIRVKIKNSKFVGCNFIDSRIYHFISEETIFKYANFSNTSLEEMKFENCDLNNSSFEEAKLKHIYFENSQLIQSLFYRTKLNGIDFSTCEINGITTSIEDLKGAIVNNFQAIELSKLLGIIIK